eukprot:464762_1
MSVKGKSTEISMIICNSLKCDTKCTEISKNSRVNINSSSITLYVVHFIKNNINIQQIIKLYVEKNKTLKNECQKYFNLDECMITFKSIDRKYNININNANIPTKFIHFDELLKELMNE